MSDDESGTRSERPLTDQERAELYREQLKQLHVIDLVRDMMVTLVTVGYEKLGLTDQTRDLRDLTDARVAIESLRRLIEVVEGEGDPEATTLRSTLAQMQLNFARASAESRVAAAEPRGAASPAQPRAAGAPSPGAAPEPAVPPAGGPGAAKEPSEPQSRPGVETESEAEKAPSAQMPPRQTAAKAGKAAPKKAAPKKSAPEKPAPEKPAPKKAASSPKRAPRKKPSGGETPPGA
jgi:hypothetical protein